MPVETTGAASLALPLTAIAGADQTVNAGQPVTLDGSNSIGNITGYPWTSVPGGLTLPATRSATFTAPTVTAATDYTITLTITGTGANGATGTATDDVIVHVLPGVGAPVARITLTAPAEAVATGTTGWSVPQAWPVTLSASTSDNASTYLWTATPAAVFTGPTGVTGRDATFTFPKTTSPTTIALKVCNSAAAPLCNTTTKVLTPQVDTLTVARARFSSGRWVVAGTATSKVPNSINVYAGATIPAGRRDLGRSVHRHRGRRRAGQLPGLLDARNSRVPGNTRVSIESARGGVLVNQAVR